MPKKTNKPKPKPQFYLIWHKARSIKRPVRLKLPDNSVPVCIANHYTTRDILVTRPEVWSDQLESDLLTMADQTKLLTIIQCNPDIRELPGPEKKSLISGLGLFYIH